MKHISYIVYAENGYGEGEHISCDSEARAKEEAEAIMERNPKLISVGIYKLSQVGKRQSAIAWDEATESVLEPPKSNGHYSAWTDAENKYLLSARAMGMTHKGIAKKLNRTVHAVEVQASRLQCG